ncbi:uncharacterized protein LOC143264543 [Megachile rotundata]|uniref:uncharacterized protein LOC143264543 n=1 Tax=Megachile rotundata TaxID=143995 RepID=UPI003FD58ED7
MSKDKASISKMGNVVTLRQVFDVLQRQNEIHAKNVAEVQRQIQILTKQSDEENKRRVKEIEMLGKTLAEMKLGLGSQETFVTEDFESINHSEAKTNTKRKDKTTRAQIPPPSDEEDDNENIRGYQEDFDETPQQLTMLSAKDLIRYIPSLNGEDDVGVEDFIKEVREKRVRCLGRDLLLKAIKVDKIVDRAAQSIRNMSIENYSDLFEALRSNVADQVTSDEYSE